MKKNTKRLICLALPLLLCVGLLSALVAAAINRELGGQSELANPDPLAGYAVGNQLTALKNHTAGDKIYGYTGREFQDLVGASMAKEVVIQFDDKGYAVVDITVSVCQASSESLLYIVSVDSAFTPGGVALANDETGFGDYKNQEGYVDITVEQAYDRSEEKEYGIRYGSTPYLKDYWPVNEPDTVLVESTVSPGITLGYSSANGFSVNQASMGGSALGANISCAYSKSLLQEDPALTAEACPTNPNCCQWGYKYSEDKAQTYCLHSNYMFEISNSGADLSAGDFRLKLDYKFVTDKGTFSPASVSTASLDFFVRAGDYWGIYDFCSGMLYT